MSKDLYAILGVDKGADANTIKKAYRKMALKYHPDKNQGDAEAEAKFKDVAEAYEILSDPDKKSRYDQMGYNSFTQGGSRRGYNQFETMEHMFDEIRKQQRAERNKRQYSKVYKLRMTMEEVYHGATKTVKYQRYDKCSSCNGQGGEDVVKCSSCNGQGFKTKITQVGNSIFQQRFSCDSCNGRGFTMSSTCKTCGGEGMVIVTEEQDIEIPHSVMTGQQLLIVGGGSFYKEGNIEMYGDLIVTIEVIEGNFMMFNKKYDLLSKIKIDYPTLVLGGSVIFKTIDGTKLNITVKPYTEIGKRLKITGKGLKQANNKDLRGDQYLEVALEMPSEISDNDKKLLEKLKKNP
jgi:molecular chaperone DnaJ